MSADLNHTRAALAHSLRRAWERYSVKLSEYDIFKISDLVLSGKGHQKHKCAHRGTYKLNYLGKNFVLVFDFLLMIVVTFLPHDSMRFMK